MDKGYPVSLNGREVVSFVLAGMESMCTPPYEITCEKRGFDRMVYYCECLGEYGINWIYCYKNNVPAEVYNARYLESIKFAEDND